MSAEAVGWVLRHSPYKGSGFACHFVVADAVNAQHDYEFWMTVPNLARFARCHEDTARAWLQTAVTDGVLEVLAESKGGRGRATTYRFLTPEPSGGCSGLPPNLMASTPESGRSAHIPIPREPKQRALTDDPLDAEFARWWEEYPRRKGSRALARERYESRRKQGVSTSDLLLAVKHYAAERDGEDPKFTMHASTFLSPSREGWSEYLAGPPVDDGLSKVERELRGL